MTPTRRWIRSVGPLPAINSRAVEQVIQEKLNEAYPPDQFPFDIQVAYTWINVTDYWKIDVRETIAMPSARDMLTPILEAVDHVITDLKVRPVGIEAHALAAITGRIRVGLSGNRAVRQ